MPRFCPGISDEESHSLFSWCGLLCHFGKIRHLPATVISCFSTGHLDVTVFSVRYRSAFCTHNVYPFIIGEPLVLTWNINESGQLDEFILVQKSVRFLLLKKTFFYETLLVRIQICVIDEKSLVCWGHNNISGIVGSVWIFTRRRLFSVWAKEYAIGIPEFHTTLKGVWKEKMCGVVRLIRQKNRWNCSEWKWVKRPSVFASGGRQWKSLSLVFCIPVVE